MAFVWKGTFIDEAAPKPARRARSEPPAALSSTASELFGGERQYTASLEMNASRLQLAYRLKAASMKASAGAASRAQAAEPEKPRRSHKRVGSGISSITTRSAATSATACTTALSEGESQSSAPLRCPSLAGREARLHDAMLVDEMQAQTMATPSAAQSEVNGLCGAFGASGGAPGESGNAMETSEMMQKTVHAPARPGAAEEASRETMASAMGHSLLPSLGSLGHPGICRQPCIHFARNDCARGASCNFCHMPHRSRTAHLDKRHRELLKKLPFADRVAIALPIIRRQASRLRAEVELKGLLDELEAVAKATDIRLAGEGRTQGAVGSLSSALGALSFRSLLTTICKASDTPDWLTPDALEGLLEGPRSAQAACAPLGLRVPQGLSLSQL